MRWVGGAERCFAIDRVTLAYALCSLSGAKTARTAAGSAHGVSARLYDEEIEEDGCGSLDSLASLAAVAQAAAGCLDNLIRPGLFFEYNLF